MAGLAHQPSRLSPRPGEAAHILPKSEVVRSAGTSERGMSEPQDSQYDDPIGGGSSSSRKDGAGNAGGNKRKKTDDPPKRGYRACVSEAILPSRMQGCFS